MATARAAPTVHHSNQVCRFQDDRKGRPYSSPFKSSVSLSGRPQGSPLQFTTQIKCVSPLLSGCTQRIRLFHSLCCFLWMPYLLMYLSKRLISDDHRGVHSDSLLRHFESFIVTLHFAKGICKVIVVVGIEGVAINGFLVVFNGLFITAKRIVCGGKLIIAFWITFELLQ